MGTAVSSVITRFNGKRSLLMEHCFSPHLSKIDSWRYRVVNTTAFTLHLTSFVSLQFKDFFCQHVFELQSLLLQFSIWWDHDHVPFLNFFHLHNISPTIETEGYGPTSMSRAGCDPIFHCFRSLRQCALYKRKVGNVARRKFTRSFQTKKKKMNPKLVISWK
jgi:hypothetical protein